MKKKDEFISPKQERIAEDKIKISLHDFLTGDVLASTLIVKQWAIILYIALLMILYVANKHQYESEQREYIKIKKEVAILQFKYMELRSELMKYSRQSQVLEKIKSRGLDLELSSNPPMVLEQD